MVGGENSRLRWQALTRRWRYCNGVGRAAGLPSLGPEAEAVISFEQLLPFLGASVLVTLAPGRTFCMCSRVVCPRGGGWR